jgi:CheY-like chemotaxis protein
MEVGMVEKVKQSKLLVLSHKDGSCKDIFQIIGHHFDVTYADSVVEALRLLSRNDFTAVLSQASDFLPLEKAVVSEQAISILNTIGEGVCLVGGEGIVLWENEKMGTYSDLVKAEISQRSCEAYDGFYRQIASGVSEKDLRMRKYSFTEKQSERYFEMTTTSMLDDQGKLVRVASVIHEATASRKLQKRIDAIDKAGRELVRLDTESIGTLDVSKRIELVQDKVVKYARELLNFQHFVVRIINKKTNQLEVLFGVGLPEEAEKIEIFANDQNNGITGYVVTTGRSYICNNPAQDSRYLTGLPSVQCTLTVPLRIHDKVIGALNVESIVMDAFGEEDRQVAEIFGRYIAISLNILDLLVTERFHTAGQTADNLHEGVSEPLDQILMEASQLKEDYIGHDDMRKRLDIILDNVCKIRGVVRSVQDGPKGILTSFAKTQTPLDPNLFDKRILVIDDEDFIRNTVCEVVLKHGMLPDKASDGKEALLLLSQQKYDLVISDIKMPYADGYEIYSAAKKIDVDIAVILMTGFGYDPNHSIVRCNKEEGLSAVLYKPFKVDQLMTEIRHALGVKPK